MPKIAIFGDLGGFKPTKVKVSVIVGTRARLPHAKLCKKCLRGYPFGANKY